MLYDLSYVSEYQNYEYLSVVLQKTTTSHWDEIFSEGHSYILEVSFHEMFVKLTRIVQKLKKYRVKMQDHENKNVPTEKMPSPCLF